MTSDDGAGGQPTPRVLAGRRILIISPQPWDHLAISKHHYAEELALTNDVMFLEPPGAAGVPRIELRPHSHLPRLSIASWRPLAPKLLRFHWYPAYRAVMRRNAAWLAHRLGRPDVVWSFDFNVFPDLDAFGAQFAIFHPVDPLSSQQQAAIGATADLVISVSERILANFPALPATTRRLLVNHGLSGPFAALAHLPVPSREAEPIRCGFFGNLNRQVINFDLLHDIMTAHEEIEFHFWGPYRGDGAFARRLLPLANAHAHGATEKTALARAAARMDLFVLPYLDHPTESDRSNAHKLLEYMSIGKAIVATRMDCYADDPDLVRMSREEGDADFQMLFAETAATLDTLNRAALTAKRKAFSLQFTYEQNVARIDAALAALVERRVTA